MPTSSSPRLADRRPGPASSSSALQPRRASRSDGPGLRVPPPPSSSPGPADLTARACEFLLRPPAPPGQPGPASSSSALQLRRASRSDGPGPRVPPPPSSSPGPARACELLLRPPAPPGQPIDSPGPQAPPPPSSSPGPARACELLLRPPAPPGQPIRRPGPTSSFDLLLPWTSRPASSSLRRGRESYQGIKSPALQQLLAQPISSRLEASHRLLDPWISLAPLDPQRSPGISSFLRSLKISRDLQHPLGLPPLDSPDLQISRSPDLQISSIL
ncbi:hypothetical protein CTA1_10614 [Colletotrichum tanaceti]|uniref:Uncharacterized protein n=1 Tax=Colletotrichum tanaceti TaxID=1306861 RepID=A0A4U6XLL6_9PEZI|nr:hypothetical protein CTA1_10614 [Colletotrichum tanaceti]